jgi:hypothetical protein
MTRRELLALVPAAAVTAVAVAASAQDRGEATMFDEILKASMDGKKGITLFLKGQAIAGVVVKMGAGAVELRSQQYSRIVVRIDSIDGAALV